MQTETNPQAEFIEVKSPIDRFREEWARLPDAIPFLRQRRLVLQNPDLVQYAEHARARGWQQPLMFALQGLLLVAFVLSTFSWLLTKDKGRQTDEIAQVQADLETQLKTEQGVIDAAEFNLRQVQVSRKNSGFTVATSTNLTKDQAIQQLNTIVEETGKSEDDYKLQAEIKVQNLRAAGDGFALAASGTPVIFTLALIFAAPLFHRGIQKQYGRYRLSDQADSHYLYSVASRGVWVNCGLVVALNLILSASGYGLDGLVESPIVSVLLWLGIYGGLLYWFYEVSKDLYKGMLLPRPRDYTALDNKILISMHTSFLAAFVVFEGALAGLAYGVYVLEKAR